MQLVNKHQRTPKGQPKMNNTEELATQGTQNKEKQNKNITNMYWIRVITKLPNSEQSYKGKVKTHKYINRQNQSTTGKL